jgi:hypothetical protein
MAEVYFGNGRKRKREQEFIERVRKNPQFKKLIRDFFESKEREK